jgi:hypothetical protein
MARRELISIWFFIGMVLLAYGVIIVGAAVYGFYAPPAHPPVLWRLHAGFWWGLLVLALGVVYTWAYAPWRR